MVESEPVWFLAGLGIGAGIGFAIGFMVAKGTKGSAVTSFTYNKEGQITGVIEK